MNTCRFLREKSIEHLLLSLQEVIASAQPAFHVAKVVLNVSWIDAKEWC